MDEQCLRGNPPSTYWLTRALYHSKLLETCEERAEDPGTTSKETYVLMKLFYQMHRDYRLAINAPVDDIEALEKEVA